MHEEIINGIVSLIVLGAAAQWVAWWLGIPSILMLLVAGFAAGPLTGFFRPEEVLGELTFPFVSLAAAVVLFEGGLTASWDEIRGVAGPVRRLILLGIPITWALTTLAARYVLGLSVDIALLLAAILVVTGPTVIGPLLRHARLKDRTESVLKLEGILNDPFGAVLAVLVFQGITADRSEHALSVVASGVLKALVFGSLLGLLSAFLFVQLRKRDLLPEFLHNAVVLPFALAAYAAGNAVQAESGLLTVTVMGIALASQKKVSIDKSVEFTEHARVLLISALFILLTARMKLSDITGLSFRAAGFVALVIFAIRPLTVWVSTVRTELSPRERTFVGCVAPRGVVAAAVSSVFGLELVDTGFEEASVLMPVTFLVIAATVTIYGLGASPLARRLGLQKERPHGVLILGANQVARAIAERLQAEGFRVLLVDSDKQAVREARNRSLETEVGQILSRSLLRRLDLEGIGHFIALSTNDDLNTLAATHFADRFGSENTYQVVPSTGTGAPKQHYADKLQAQHFADGQTFEKLSSLVLSGAATTVTPLEGGPSRETFRDRFGPDAVPLFVINDDKTLAIVGQDESFPDAGALVSLTPYTG